MNRNTSQPAPPKFTGPSQARESTPLHTVQRPLRNRGTAPEFINPEKARETTGQQQARRDDTPTQARSNSAGTPRVTAQRRRRHPGSTTSGLRKREKPFSRQSSLTSLSRDQCQPISARRGVEPEIACRPDTADRRSTPQKTSENVFLNPLKKPKKEFLRKRHHQKAKQVH